MKRYLVSELAEVDLAEIHSYIARHRPAAADRMIARLFRAFGTIAGQPEIGERRDDLVHGLRILVVKNYAICYAATEVGIEISRVLHGARDIAAIFRHTDDD